VTQRPFYLIAHQCNDISDIGGALAAGANGIELDVHWESVGGEAASWWVYHDDVTSPSYTRLSGWLDEAKKQADAQGQQFALIYYDIKTPDTDQLSTLRDLTRSKLPIDLNVLYSTAQIPGTIDLNSSSSPAPDHFKDLAPGQRFNEGMAIDSQNDCVAVAKYFTGLGVMNYWYGDGISSLTPGFLTAVESSVQSGVSARDKFNEIKKVYVWTLADSDSIKSYLDMGVDAILVEANPLGSFTATNIVATVKQVDGRSDVRMATRSDFAFFRVAPDGNTFDCKAIEENWTGWIPNYTPIDAAVLWPDGKGYFFKGNQYFIYEADDTVPLNYSRPVGSEWIGWPSDFFPIDAAIFWPPTGKAYFFKGDQYIRYNLSQYGGSEGVDEGPTPIKNNWPGLSEALGLDASSGLDAAIYWPNGNAYFFKGEQCVKYASGVNQNEPEGVLGKPIPFDAELKQAYAYFGIQVGSIQVDAAVYWPNGMVYLMTGSNYISYNPPQDPF
jgi:glycerophosphoryl diester phosphodiesterase